MRGERPLAETRNEVRFRESSEASWGYDQLASENLEYTLAIVLFRFKPKSFESMHYEVWQVLYRNGLEQQDIPNLARESCPSCPGISSIKLRRALAPLRAWTLHLFERLPNAGRQ